MLHGNCRGRVFWWSPLPFDSVLCARQYVLHLQYVFAYINLVQVSLWVLQPNFNPESNQAVQLWRLVESTVTSAAKKCSCLTFRSSWDGNIKSTVFLSPSTLSLCHRYVFPVIVGGKEKGPILLKLPHFKAACFEKLSKQKAATSLQALSHCTAGEDHQGLRRCHLCNFRARKVLGSVNDIP